jgi:4-amino-4-deoxy-L-arabinose transferase-like glycosyltransferase
MSKDMTRIRSLFREPTLRLLTLGFLFVVAFSLRLYGLGQLPMGFNPPREYHGALLARGFYEWWLTGNLKTIPPDGIIEPPILEFVASFFYLILGEEHLWIPRLLSALFWMAGGVFLYLIAKRIVSPYAAVFCVFFYLFVPYGVLASRAFMPDPLMIMLLLVSIFAVLRYHEQPSTRRLIVAAVTSSLAVFVKPGISLFQIFGAFVSLAVYRQGVRKALISPHLLLFGALTVLPTGLYGLYATFFAGFYQRQVSNKVVPQLLLEASFWEGWFVSVSVVLGYVALFGALFGVLLLRERLPRALMIGLWSGYFLFALVFTKHISQVTYYSLQLIPVVALSLGPLADLVMKALNHTVNNIGQLGWSGYGRLIVLALSISVLILSAIGNRQSTSWMRAQQERAASYVATFQEIGEVVDHSHRTLVLFGGYITTAYYWEPNYTYALMYHGRFLGDEWPYPIQSGNLQARESSAEELFYRRYRRHSPEYLVISKGLWKRDETKGLRAFLTENFSVAAQGDTYVVFDLRRNLDGTETNATPSAALASATTSRPLL